MESNTGRKYVLSLHTVTLSMLLVIIVVLFILLGSMPQTQESFQRVEDVTGEFVRFQNSAFALKNDIGTLSDRAKTFVVTHDPEEAVTYFNEMQMSQLRRNNPSETENTITDEKAQRRFQAANELAERIMHEQSYAMRLILEADGRPLDTYPVPLQEIMLSETDSALTPEAKEQRARNIVFGPAYSAMLAEINVQLEQYNRSVTDDILARQAANEAQLKVSISRRQSFIFRIMAVLLISMTFILVLIFRPVSSLAADVRYGQAAKGRGISEIQYLADSFNHFRRRMDDVNLKLSYKASHDSLTGLYNRNAYDEFRQSSSKKEMALIIIDVDFFKEINDTYGYEMGDRLLTRVAQVISQSFRESDRVCRIGGNEFSIFMQGINSSRADIVHKKVAQTARALAMPDGDIPAITVSAGVAFSDQVEKREDLFRAADYALYRIKLNGRNGCGFYTGRFEDDVIYKREPPV